MIAYGAGMATRTAALRQDIETKTKQAWWSLLALGILSILFGVVILVWPGPTTLVAGIMFGIFLIVGGLVQIVEGIMGDSDNRLLSIVSGALALVLGAFCFRDDIANSVAVLGVFIGISWIFGGVWGVTAGVAGQHLPHRTWTIIAGVLTLIGGFVLIASPWDSMMVLMLVTGIFAIAIGLVEIVGAFRLRSAAKEVAQKVDDVTGKIDATVGRVEGAVTQRLDGISDRVQQHRTTDGAQTDGDKTDGQ
ncbi:hypothetical protein GCM10009551_077660 [Nocardiopsis tropica]